MKTFTVRWAEVAERDLAEIGMYVAEDSLDKALRVLKRIEERAEALKHYPNRGRIVPELSSHGITLYREVIEKPWRIIYRVEGRRVWVHGVLDGRRLIEDLLLERLLR